MTHEELQNRITKKTEEIAKTEKLLNRYLSESSDTEREIINRFLQCGDYSLHRGLGYSDAWGKAVALYDARKTLQKYQDQLKMLELKESEFAQLPAILIQFRDNLIEKWDMWDAWKQEQIKEDIKRVEKLPYSEYRLAVRELQNKWGRGFRDFYYLTKEQIHKANVTAADSIVTNLVNRTKEICGTITDAQGLYLDSDNQGYLIINGIVKGEKGNARVESIGAGGYNIQRYHIRVLVKPIK